MCFWGPSQHTHTHASIHVYRYHVHSNCVSGLVWANSPASVPPCRFISPLSPVPQSQIVNPTNATPLHPPSLTPCHPMLNSVPFVRASPLWKLIAVRRTLTEVNLSLNNCSSCELYCSSLLEFSSGSTGHIEAFSLTRSLIYPPVWLALCCLKTLCSWRTKEKQLVDSTPLDAARVFYNLIKIFLKQYTCTVAGFKR